MDKKNVLFNTKLYSFEEIRPYDHIYLRNLYSFVWIQHNCFPSTNLEGQLSVSGERMSTILVNRFEDSACPVKCGWIN